MRNHVKSLTFTIVFAFCTSVSQSAVIETFDFYGLTNNSPGNIITGQSQIFVDISDPGPDTYGNSQVMFTFRNIGPEVCALTEIYFDNGSLLRLASIINSPPDVAFRYGNVAPKNLPGANLADPDFVAVAGFSLEPEIPEPHYGVNPGEQFSAIFTLDGTLTTVYDIIGELYTGDLRIGIHMQAFYDDNSDSFVNRVPEPATMILFSAGLLFIRRSRR